LDKKQLYHHLWIPWLLIILILSFIPGDKIPEIKFTLFEIDKLIHFSIYFILALLMCYDFCLKKNEPLLKKVVITIAIGISIGYLVEVIQGNFITNRFFDTYDVLANTCGTITGSILFNNIRRNKLKTW
jgi:VanZ family protein